VKSFTLFSGFEGVGIGMKAAGWQHVGGIEYDDKIASVARTNGFDVTTADVLKVCPNDFPAADWLHASPPCPNFSNAKTDGEETEQDIALAQAVANWIISKRPSFFTLENVYQYRNSQSWEIIARALLTHGYSLNYWHVNMADYGVPQTRRRMIVIARRDGRMPMLPPATHAENPANGLFGMLKRWVGWYEAIEDIWGEKRLYVPSERLLKHIQRSRKTIPEIAIMDGQNTSFDDQRLTIVESAKPIFTINANRSPTEYLIKNGEYYAIPISFVLRWQTFPDNYKEAFFYGIGNAVPPLFIQRLGESLL
jgi:DNA (cytosine-5)-methyltransferase 1